MNAIQQDALVKTRGYSLFFYDIPSDATLEWHPAWELRRFAVRLNLSVWVVPTDRLHLIPVDTLRERRVECEVVRFSEADSDLILRLALKGLTRDLEGLRDAVVAGIAKTREQVLLLNYGEREEESRALGYAYRALQAAKRHADAAEEAALVFDLGGDVAELIAGVRSVRESHLSVFEALKADARRRTRGDASQLEMVS